TAAHQVVVIMGAKFSALKTLVIPAIIALILYLVLTFAVIPIWIRYRNRYSQYLPLETITDGASSLRARITDRITTWFITSAWRSRLQDRIEVADNRPSTDFDSDDGEELNDVDEALRRALERREQPSIDDNSNRRLSRDWRVLRHLNTFKKYTSCLGSIHECPLQNSEAQPPHPEFRYQLRDDDPALFTHVVPRKSGSGIVGSVPHTVPEAPLKRYDVPGPYQSYRPVRTVRDYRYQ
ncbi:hypothetical protein B0T20DRAFT_351857, partial [Sordaria brevicollis]